MDLITQLITKYKKIIVSIFISLMIIGALLMTQVKINYNLTDYLPKDAQSTIALDIMEEEFTEAIPNARVMISDVSIPEALKFKDEIKSIEGISSVMWLDDIVNLKEPIEMADKDTVESYYKDNTALFSVSIDKSYEISVSDKLYELVGENNALAGDAISTAAAQKMATKESLGAMVLLVPVIIIILVLTSSSWIEPILFLSAIGVAVLINMGTNVFMKDVSNVTQSVTPILQMAVSLDYAIFLLHSFERNRKNISNAESAMRAAIKESFPAIAASAATTLFGFLALLFMRFQIGSNMGISLVKGIILSYLAVMVFLPALTLLLYKLIDKTRHKKFIPEFNRLGKVFATLRIPAMIIALVVVIPAYLAQSQANFFYGTGSPDSATRIGADTITINEKFGQQTAVVALVPKGDIARELELCNELNEMEHIDSTITYVTSVGATIPSEFLGNEIVSNFYSDKYTRIIINTDTNEEGEEAFLAVKNIREKISKYYDTYYTCGQSTNLYDMKDVVSSDNARVNLFAIIAIAVVLLVTFRSITLPVVLLFVIETAIWVNLSVPYFQGNSLSYIGYLVINTVQLGATIDYAILITENYRKNRMEMNKKDAIIKTLNGNFISILTSASILSAAGFGLASSSSNVIIIVLGTLLARGTILSLLMVTFVLPGLLLIFDKLIGITTIRSNFYKEAK